MTRYLIVIVLNLLVFNAYCQITTLECVTNPDTIQGQIISIFPDKSAVFGNNIREFQDFLKNNFQIKQDPNFPIYTLKVTFIIDSSGNVQKPCVLNNRDHPNFAMLQETFIQAMAKCPRWKPGIINNKPVPTRFTIMTHIKYL